MTGHTHLLDTNIISDLIKQPTGSVAKRIAALGEDRICTSIIVASELRYGAAKKGSPQFQKKIADILNEIPVLPFEAPADEDYGIIRSELEKIGQPIGSNDLIIAAQVLSLKMTLVTANVREFKRVPGLQIENWLT